MKHLILLLALCSTASFGQSIKKNADGTGQVFFKDGSSGKISLGAKEVILVTGSATAWVNTVAQEGGNAGILIPPGGWLLQAFLEHVPGTVSALTMRNIGVNTALGNVGPFPNSVTQITMASHTPPTGSFHLSSPMYYVNVTTATRYYPKIQINGTPGTSTVKGDILAIRIH